MSRGLGLVHVVRMKFGKTTKQKRKTRRMSRQLQYMEEQLAKLRTESDSSDSNNGSIVQPPDIPDETTTKCLTIYITTPEFENMAFISKVIYDPADSVHYLNVGQTLSGGAPCVSITVYEDHEEHDNSCQLQGARFAEDCCVGGGMRRGTLGTVWMVKGALLAASNIEPFASCDKVTLMDTSYKPSTDTSCSDAHMIMHGRTWYEEKFGAEVHPTWARALVATREALSRPLALSKEDLVKELKTAATSQKCFPWFKRIRPEIEAICDASISSSTSCRGLLKSLILQLDQKGRMIRTVLTALKSRSVCPGWETTYGWSWIIPMSRIRVYTSEMTAEIKW